VTKKFRRLRAVGAVACVALAGCAASSSAGGSRAAVSAAADQGASPQQQARTDATAMLAQFVPPPGATRLASAPAASGGFSLAHKAFEAGVSDQVDVASFWRVPAPAGSVLDFEKAHLPRQFSSSGTGTVGDNFGSASLESWILPGIPGVIGMRELTVEVTSPSSNVTYVRVDSNVAWIPPRPASEKVPAGATVVTITATPDMNHPKGTPAPVTITDPAKVAKIAAALDGLYLDTSGSHGCPAEAGKSMTLAFRAAPGGPVLATATAVIPSCGSVSFSVGGVQRPALADWGPFTSKVLAIAGVHWPDWYI
jgi:hypothetical protein